MHMCSVVWLCMAAHDCVWVHAWLCTAQPDRHVLPHMSGQLSIGMCCPTRSTLNRHVLPHMSGQLSMPTAHLTVLFFTAHCPLAVPFFNCRLHFVRIFLVSPLTLSCRFLASASKDTTVMIWDATGTTVVPLHSLGGSVGHTQAAPI